MTIIIIPTYNEVENIEGLCQKTLKFVPLDTSILIVDDGSQDGTEEIINRLSGNNPRIKIIHRNGPRNFGRSYIEGFKYALKNGASYVIEMDGDFSHPPEVLPIFLKEIKENDVVIGSRYAKGGKIKNWSLPRRFISRVGCLYAKAVTGIKIADLTTGYVCYCREALKKIDLDKINSNGYAFQIEMKTRLAQMGFRIKEIPITFTERKKGESKFSFKIIWEAIWRCWKIRLSTK